MIICVFCSVIALICTVILVIAVVVAVFTIGIRFRATTPTTPTALLGLALFIRGLGIARATLGLLAAF